MLADRREERNLLKAEATPQAPKLYYYMPAWDPYIGLFLFRGPIYWFRRVSLRFIQGLNNCLYKLSFKLETSFLNIARFFNIFTSIPCICISNCTFSASNESRYVSNYIIQFPTLSRFLWWVKLNSGQPATYYSSFEVDVS